METKKVRTAVFTPNGFIRGQNCLKNLLLCSSILALSGCLTSGTSAHLAPTPPDESSAFLSAKNQDMYQPHYFADPNITSYNAGFISSNGIALDGISGVKISVNQPVDGANPSVDAVPLKQKCSISHRFDRKAVLAYEWSRSRLSIDVDGIGMGMVNNAGMRVEYKLKFQPGKTKRQKCRYSSKWQGMIGSGYNEFFIRETNTVWSELRELKQEVKSYLDDNF